MEQTISYNSTESYLNRIKDRVPQQELVKIALAEVSLHEFIKQGWHVLEPTTPFISGWHLEAICDHLQAVSKNQIKNLIINIPPRYMKSLSVSVFFPVWVWVQNASKRFLYSSYSQELSTRDAVKSRNLLQSLWFQSKWGHKFSLAGDDNCKTRYLNDKSGYRISTSVGGLGTGEGGDYIIVDDPHNVKQTESVLIREGTLKWWFETMSTRINNPRDSHKIIVMQRIHERDLTGEILARELDYEHLCLPAEFEKDRKCKTVIFEDPRKEEGDLLWEDNYGRKEIEELKVSLGNEYTIAGQLQQRPTKRGGLMFKVENLELVKDIVPSRIVKKIRYWDKAGTKDGGAYTAGVLMGRLVNDSYVVLDIIRGQWAAGEREKRIKQTALLDGIDVEVWVEQEPGSGGKESAENTIKNLSGYNVKKEHVTGAKEVRAEPFSSQVEISNISILDRDWTKEFINELELFPKGKYKDQVDAASGAFNKLSLGSRVGVW